MEKINKVYTKIMTYEGDKWNIYEDNYLWGR